jgi:hypothetical protein
MSLAWTTVLIVVFLLPGILFHAGLYSRDRIPREIVRAGVIGDIGAAVLVSLIVHLAGLALLSASGVSAERTLGALGQLTEGERGRWAELLDRDALPLGLYAVVSGIVGFVGGLGLAVTGLFVTHRWAMELKSSKHALVTAYVMTRTIVDDKVLMYRGGLTEFFLKPDGSISYIVLNDCRRFYMSHQGDELRMGRQLPVVGELEKRVAGSWNRLAIDSANISNILFEKSPSVSETEAGKEALRKALEELEAATERQSPAT